MTIKTDQSVQEEYDVQNWLSRQVDDLNEAAYQAKKSLQGGSGRS